MKKKVQSKEKKKTLKKLSRRQSKHVAGGSYHNLAKLIVFGGVI